MTHNVVMLSQSQLAAEFGVSRDTMRRTLSEAGVSPVGKGPRGHATYRLRDAIRAFNGQREPDGMNPHLRLSLAKAVETEDRIRARRGELVERWDHERNVFELATMLVNWADGVPDILERDHGLPRSVIGAIEKTLDALRCEFASRIAKCQADDAIARSLET